MSFSSRLSLPIAILVLTLAAFPSEAFASPVLTFHNPQGVIQSLEIGDDFFVSMSGLAPGQEVTFTVYDEYGYGASRRSAQADAQGEIALLGLWPWTGVVGCDPGSNPSIEAYQFVDFDQAVAILQNRMFSVTVHDENDAILVSQPLPLIASGQPRHFYSDAWGCPRLIFDRFLGDDLYLTVQNVDLTQHNLAIFIVSADQPFGPNMEILEVRLPFQNNPQVVPQGSGRAWTQLLWPANDSKPGPYVAILHFFKTLPSEHHLPGNISIAPDRGHPGVTIVPWDCSRCDPPD